MASEQLGMIIEVLRASPMFDGDFAARREALEAGAGVAPLPDGTMVDAVDVNGVPCEWVRGPGARDDRTILYLHGGGYTIGSVNTHRRVVALLSELTKARVLNVDYRLAPEHPHPAAVDDAVTVYRWLVEKGGAAPEHTVIAGDSAGGGLTAATLVAVRDQGLPLPAGGALISPWTDLTMTAETYDTRGHVDPMISRETLTPSALAYLAGADPKTPLASPLFADLTGLPPLVVHVGDFECLLDDGRDFAAAAEDAGVSVEIWVAPEMIHVWHAFAGMVPESDAALARLADWITARLG
jgi:acetyl esterase/lipase